MAFKHHPDSPARRVFPGSCSSGVSPLSRGRYQRKRARDVPIYEPEAASCLVRSSRSRLPLRRAHGRAPREPQLPPPSARLPPGAPKPRQFNHSAGSAALTGHAQWPGPARLRRPEVVLGAPLGSGFSERGLSAAAPAPGVRRVLSSLPGRPPR